MSKADSCETIQEVLHNGDTEHDKGVDTVVELLGNWFSGSELDEFLTFIKSEKV